MAVRGFSGGVESGTLSLHNIELSGCGGQVVAITGNPGQGKTALLMAILGEIPPEMGHVEIRGRKAFVPQAVITRSESAHYGRK